MGQTLSEPVTQKETSHCENEFLKVGTSCMQGWRISLFYFRFIFFENKFQVQFDLKDMEDAHTQILSLNNDKNSAFFAVYDGHGGKQYFIECLKLNIYIFVKKRF